MGWITEVFISENAKPIWGKVATALDYVIGDFRAIITTASLAGIVYVSIANIKLTKDLKNNYVSPKEHTAMISDRDKEANRADSLATLLSKREAMYNEQAFRFIDILRIKDSVIQENKFIIRGYEKVIQKTIKP